MLTGIGYTRRHAGPSSSLPKLGIIHAGRCPAGFFNDDDGDGICPFWDRVMFFSGAQIALP